MPIPTRILDNLDKQKRDNKKGLDIDVVDTKGHLDNVLLCASCNIQMGIYTDKSTGQPKGYVCPNCHRTFDPDRQTKSQHAKTVRRMTTTDGGISEDAIDMRRNIESIQNTNMDLYDNLYQARADKSSSSVTKSLKKLDYAGQKKKTDPDEELLIKQGFTILDSQERTPN